MRHVEENTPVLIVGGGLVGLSTSLFLSWQGVPHILVERHKGTSIYPKARGLHIRTMELFRSIGLDNEIKEAATMPDPQAGILIVDTLAGEEYNKMGAPPPEYDVQEFSPESSQLLIDQDRLEKILLQAAKKRGGDIRFRHEFQSFEENNQHITAIVGDRESGRLTRIQAQYVIAADGVHSSIREMLGIERSGRGVIAENVSIHFEADLCEEVRGRNFFLCFIANPQAQGLLIPTDLPERWVFSITQVRHGKAEPFTNERCAQLIRAAVGRADLPLGRNIHPMTWQAADYVADRLQAGRFFLVGDAAHQMTPAGAFGANTGIQDAHNLAWKLAYVFKGKASPGLLESYHSERHPVASAICKESRIRYFAHQGHGTEERPTLADDDAVMFGYRYASTAVVDANHSSALPSKLELRGEPGTRVPHIWIEQFGDTFSSVDLCNHNFVLFSGSDGASWKNVVHRISEQLSVTIDVYTLGAGQESAFEIEPSGAVLVRPDGYVVLRVKKAVHHSAQKLLQSFKQILHE